MAKKFDTTIVLKGMTDPSLSQAFKNAEKLTNNNINTVKQFGKIVATSFKVAGGAALAGSTISIKAAIDFESAFAGVQKTIDETDTTSYEDLSEGIRQMAKEMPAAATEIAGVAEIAGQLGISADDVLKFTKTMINLGETTNLSGEEGASMIAKFFNITGTDMEKVDAFGNVLVALGNNAATTESDIMHMASRIAGSGKQIGLTEPQILAIATSLSSVGIEAEAGGTAISQVMSQIDKDVALGTDTLETWAQTAGMSVSEFSDKWKKDAYGTIQDVIKGMGDVKNDGGNLNVVLEELGITGIRTGDTMKRLSGATELMGRMTEIANDEWSNGTALIDEANKRYGTMEARIQIMKNKFYDVAITLGQTLMPYVEKFVDWLSGLDYEAIANKVSTVVQKIIEFVKKVIEVVKQLAPVLIVIGAIFAGIKIAQFIAGLITLGKTVFFVIKAFGLFGTLSALVGGPVVLIVGLVAGLIAVFVLLWNKCEGFRNFFIGMWEGIKSFFAGIPEFFGNVVLWIQEKFSKLGAFFSGLWDTIKEKFSALGTTISEAISGAVKAGINGIISLIELKINAGIGLINGAINLINKIPGVNIGNFPTVSLPRLAEGGVLAKGQVGLLEGSGAEAVVPLEKNNMWISRVADLMMSHLGMGNALASLGNAFKGSKIATAINSPIANPISDVPVRGSNNVYNFTFAPVINGGDVEANRQMLREEEQSFEQKMKEYFSGKVRLEF